MPPFFFPPWHRLRDRKAEQSNPSEVRMAGPATRMPETPQDARASGPATAGRISPCRVRNQKVAFAWTTGNGAERPTERHCGLWAVALVNSCHRAVHRLKIGLRYLEISDYAAARRCDATNLIFDRSRSTPTGSPEHRGTREQTQGRSGRSARGKVIVPSLAHWQGHCPTLVQAMGTFRTLRARTCQLLPNL